MGDASLKCPFCCDKLFNSKEEIIEHLANILGNISCPICKNKWSSLNQLIQHLSLDDCQSQVPTETITFDTGPESTINDLNSEDSNLIQLPEPKILASDDISNVKTSESFPIIESKEVGIDGSDMGKMYVELLGKQLATPCLQTQELKLVKHNGVSRYVFMVNDDSNMSLNNTVVTKQNHDGTISMTTVKDLKMESDADTVITQENDLTQENQEEIYSCNTCGVSFTSVIEHIQTYHNDQEVVVEGPLEDTVNNVVTQEEAPLDNMLSDQIAMDKQTMRRMITDTGDIVEEPTADSMSKELVMTGTNEDPLEIPKEETDKVETKPKRKRYVQINKFCDSVVKDINPTKDKNNPYHKVVVKEMRTYEGETVRVYNCMVCHVYVTSLDDFKSQPCKQLKYSCTQCTESYHSSKSLYAHMKVHKRKPETGVTDPATLAVPITFECEVCSTVFSTNKSLKLHRRMHDPIKARPIEPPVETAEGTEVSLDRFHCAVCDKMIPMDYKTIHQNSHKNTTMFNCDICNKKFQSSQYLEMHMNVHAADKVTVNKQDKSLPYTCLYCDRRFARPHEKVKHERIHTGEKPHTCAICGKSFRVSYCLTLHMRTHTGARPYSCQHCGKRFKAHSVYNHHLLTHSEVRAYKCPYCPKAFKTSVQLAGHKNSHTKPFSCQHCNRPFASLYAVRVHTETHARQNNLKFACTLCGASYARAFALKDHIKQVHQQNVIDEKELVTVPGTFDVVG